MKRLLMTSPVAALLAVLVCTPDAGAFGRRNKGCDTVGYAPAPVCAPAPTTVTWVDQVVTTYRTEWRTREVPVTVTRPVYREEVRKEKRTYVTPTMVKETRMETVTVPKWVTETVNQTVTVPQYVKEVQTYSVTVPKWVTETVNQTVTVPVPRKEMRTVTVMKPEFVKETHTQTFTRPVHQTVLKPVVRCRMVPVTHCDPCTGCVHTTCRPETYVEQVPVTVCNYVTEQRPVEVTVCRYRPHQETQEVTVVDYKTEQRPVQVTVCRPVTEQRQQEVTVCRYTTEQRPVQVTVCRHVTEQRPVEYMVCKHITDVREEDVRYVHTEWKQETVMQTQSYCERVPVQTVVKVPVCVPAPVAPGFCH